MEHSHVVGIDVSKTHLDAHVRPTGDSFRVSHDEAGFVTLLERLRPLAPTVVVLEATGHAHRDQTQPRDPRVLPPPDHRRAAG